MTVLPSYGALTVSVTRKVTDWWGVAAAALALALALALSDEAAAGCTVTAASLWKAALNLRRPRLLP